MDMSVHFFSKNESIETAVILGLTLGSVIWSCGPSQVIAIPIILASSITALFCKILKCFMNEKINSKVYPKIERTQIVALATVLGAHCSLIPVAGSGLGVIVWLAIVWGGWG